MHPHITFCSLIWGGLFIGKFEPLNKAHKRVIRTIMGLRRYDCTNDSYKRLRLLNLEGCIDFRFENIVFEAISKEEDIVRVKSKWKVNTSSPSATKSSRESHPEPNIRKFSRATSMDQHSSIRQIKTIKNSFKKVLLDQIAKY